MMITEYEFNRSVESKNNIFLTILHSLFILSDFLLVPFLFLFPYFYLKDYILIIQRTFFASSEAVLFSGLLNIVSTMTLGIFLILFFKTVLGSIFLSLPFTKNYYIKYLSSYFGKEMYFEFRNNYQTTKLWSNSILVLTFLFTIFGFSFFRSLDSSGIQDHFLFFKYNNTPWKDIHTIDYKLIIWYDTRSSREKLREKFLIKGSFGELDIMDYGNTNAILNLISIAKKYGNVTFHADNPNNLKTREFLENYSKDKREEIFKIYNEIINY